MVQRLKSAGGRLLPGFVLACLIFGGLFVYEHRRDHQYLHGLIELEQRRQAVLKQQQDAQAAAIKGPVITPEKPPVASSPVPEIGRK